MFLKKYWYLLHWQQRWIESVVSFINALSINICCMLYDFEPSMRVNSAVYNNIDTIILHDAMSCSIGFWFGWHGSINWSFTQYLRMHSFHSALVYIFELSCMREVGATTSLKRYNSALVPSNLESIVCIDLALDSVPIDIWAKLCS